MIIYQFEIGGSLKMSPAQFSKLLDHNTVVAINAVMKQTQKIAKDPIPSGKSGIRKAIGFEKATVGTKVAVVGTSHPKMIFVEEDTKPHAIKPKKGKFLAFKINGRTIFTKRVDHPGTKGKHSFAKADDFTEKQLLVQLQNAVEATLQGKRYSPLTANLISALSSLI
jgi:hypothetical protein